MRVPALTLKRASRIPKSCEAVVPASIEGPIDIPALVKEAYCKGGGDMLTEYSYVMNSVGRSKQERTDERRIHHLRGFIPTLKSGTRGKSVLVITSRNGVPVRADELGKARLEAAKRLVSTSSGRLVGTFFSLRMCSI